MLGTIIGDIVGSRWEFNSTNDYNFELFSDKNSFTDDTICTIAIADAILKGRDFGESLHYWCRKYPHPMGGYGGRFAQWVRSDNPKPYGSFGNGSAMRVSPVGWLFDQSDALLDYAKRTAECTHNHEDGIAGAQAVAVAISECRNMRKEYKGKTMTANDIRMDGLYHAIYMSSIPVWPSDFDLNLEDYRNKFDETCQGTVPVAFAIIMHSTSFEDAIRKAVSLGGDADTLGAIVGSIAEALWGIPEWIKEKALSYLPNEMRKVVDKFHRYVVRCRKLSQRCEYYRIGDLTFIKDEHKMAFDVERKWAHDLAISYDNATRIKEDMAKLSDIKRWQKWADEYDLPLSLMGYIFKHTSKGGPINGECVKSFERFLCDNYSCRIEDAKKKKEKKEAIELISAKLLWKLGLGNMGKFFIGENPMPAKDKTANKNSWKIEPMPGNPKDVSTINLQIPVSAQDMAIIHKGPIPEAMEDHWFMYCSREYIRYYRSWTGMCAFEAHFIKNDDGTYTIDRLKMNHALLEFGVNNYIAGAMLFRYLLTAEIGADANGAWQLFLHHSLHLTFEKGPRYSN